MAKQLPNTPDRHDRVAMRGRLDRLGTMPKYNPKTNWATVKWDDSDVPQICHRFELQKVIVEQPTT